MNPKALALGVILVFIGFAVSQIVIPFPVIYYLEPFPGIRIPLIRIDYINPVGWLVYPLALVGAVLIIFGLTTKAVPRLILLIIASATLFLTTCPLLGVI